MVISNNSMTAVADTASFTVNNGLEIPTTFGAGLSWNHADKLKLGADFSYQKWGSLEFPVYRVVNETPSYELTDNYYSDRYKVTFGGEFCNNWESRRFLTEYVSALACPTRLHIIRSTELTVLTKSVPA